jgi:Asp-tRNA(Asn)/Glu-tRNA(Gln) amidotransferase A subunit family amidase
LHEFAYGFSSENDWWGPIHNPWDPSTSPGGSSGGSAVAVAAGITPIGIGTDTGGSVRVPAALCGLIGLKVSHGRIPLRGVFPLAASVDTVGPMSTTINGVAAGYVAMAVHDPHDQWSRDMPVAPIAHGRFERLTVGIPHPWVDRSIAPEQAVGFQTAIDAFAALGATIRDIEEPSVRADGVPPGAYAEVADVHRSWFEQDPTRYGSAIRDRLAPVLELTDRDIETAATWRNDLKAGFDRVLQTVDVILTPATAARAKQIGREEIDVGDGPEPYRPVLSWFTPIVNQAGLPALSLPIEAPGVPGLPPSIQIIGPMWSESDLLSIATELDRHGVVAHRAPSDLTRAR